MKTERRQELRTNELSEQIEQITDYVRRNGLLLSAVVLAAAVVFGGYFWYSSHRQAKANEAWASLSRMSREPDDAVVLSQIEAVANQDISPSLTAEALLLLGEKAMRKMAPTRSEAAQPAPEDVAAWASKAKTAFESIIRRFPTEVTALGTAMMQLGVLHENQSEIAAAREIYEKIRSDARFQHTPFRALAEFRLARLDQWASPVVFPPALMTVPEPPPEEAATARPGALPLFSQGLPPEAAAQKPDSGATPEQAAPDATSDEPQPPTESPVPAGENPDPADEKPGEPPNPAADPPAPTQPPADGSSTGS